MAKSKLKPKYRITKDPELFIEEKKSKVGTKWVVKDLNDKTLDICLTEESAKKCAIRHARSFLKIPRDYEEMYEQKVKGWEMIHKEQMILPEDEQ